MKAPSPSQFDGEKRGRSPRSHCLRSPLLRTCVVGEFPTAPDAGKEKMDRRLCPAAREQKRRVNGSAFVPTHALDTRHGCPVRCAFVSSRVGHPGFANGAGLLELVQPSAPFETASCRCRGLLWRFALGALDRPAWSEAPQPGTTARAARNAAVMQARGLRDRADLGE
jgi:hypothetical protein